MAVEFNTAISVYAFAAYNKSGSSNSWGTVNAGYGDSSVNWLGYAGQNAAGVRYAFCYAFTTPSWQGDETLLTLYVNLAEELGRNRTIQWALTSTNPTTDNSLYTSSTLPTDAGRVDSGTLTVTANSWGTYTITVDLTSASISPNSTYYLVLFPDTTSSGTSNYISVPNKDSSGNLYSATDILDGAITYEAEASGVSAPNGYFGQAMTISMTDDGLSKTLTYSCAGATGTIVSGTTAASVSWTPPASLMSRIPADTSAECTITCTTSAGETTCTCTLTVPESIKPTIGNLSLDIVNANSTVDGWGICLQNFSQIETQFYAVARYSRLVSWSIDGGAFSLEGTISNALTFTGDQTSSVLAAAGTYTVKVTVTDQRGRSTTVTVGTYTVTAYTAPTATGFNVYRCDSSGTADDDGTYLYAVATKSYTQVGNNTCTMYFEYKEKSASSWTRHSTAMQDGVGIVAGGGNIDILKSYSTRVYVEDSLGGAYVYYGVSTQAVAFNLRPTGNSGAAFGGYSTEDKVVELLNGWRLRVQDAEHITVWSADGQTEITLADLIDAGGGSGGTSDYDQLSNRPSINGVVLTGNKTAANLSLESTGNKVTSVSSSSTDDQYPTAKCLYTLAGNIETLLAAL